MLSFPLPTIAVVAAKSGTAFTATIVSTVVPTITNGFTTHTGPDELVGSDKCVFSRQFRHGFVSHRFTLPLVMALLSADPSVCPCFDEFFFAAWSCFASLQISGNRWHRAC